MRSISRFMSFIILGFFVLISISCSSSDDSKNRQDIAIENQRILSVGKLLESVSRNPYYEFELINQHETCSLFDGSYLESEDYQLIEARVVSFGKYLEAVARQSEREPILRSVFDNYAGLLNPTLIAPCEKALYMRNLTIGYLLDAVARQPEISDFLMATAREYIGTYDDYSYESMTTPLVLAGRVQLTGKLIENVARQSGIAADLEELVTLFAGDKSTVTGRTDCIVNSARMDVLSFLTEASGRQPELFMDIDGCLGDSCGMFLDFYTEQVGLFQREQLRGGCILPVSLSISY